MAKVTIFTVSASARVDRVSTTNGISYVVVTGKDSTNCGNDLALAMKTVRVASKQQKY